MKTENRLIMKKARETLSGNWWLAVGTVFVWYVIHFVVQSTPKTGGLVGLLVAGPMFLGLTIFFLALSRNQNPRFEQIFEGFRVFGTTLGAYLLMMLYTILWSLLLIIPGIIAALSYSMVFYIIADDNEIGIRESIRKSKKMMYGYKWKLFCLMFRFFWWGLLCLLTLGIGFLWLIPYMQTSLAIFYDEIKTPVEA